jgi:hypothetical protein
MQRHAQPSCGTSMSSMPSGCTGRLRGLRTLAACVRQLCGQSAICFAAIPCTVLDLRSSAVCSLAGLLPDI